MPTIDQYSLATVPLEMMFQTTPLALGTGFFFESDGTFFLVSNWHNFSGRNPSTGACLSRTGAEPDRLRIWWNKKNQLGSKFAVETALRNGDGLPLWLVHPIHGHEIDIAVLPITPKSDAEPYPINRMPSASLAVTIGSDISILGYPYGIGPNGLPIWKRASIASEPQLAGGNGQHFILVDTASRPGMSGSPVIVRSWGASAMEDGSTAVRGVATRLLGVYSGRLATNDPLDAQLGMVWPIDLVPEIIAGSTRDLGT